MLRKHQTIGLFFIGLMGVVHQVLRAQCWLLYPAASSVSFGNRYKNDLYSVSGKGIGDVCFYGKKEIASLSGLKYGSLFFLNPPISLFKRTLHFSKYFGCKVVQKFKNQLFVKFLTVWKNSVPQTGWILGAVLRIFNLDIILQDRGVRLICYSLISNIQLPGQQQMEPVARIVSPHYFFSIPPVPFISLPYCRTLKINCL
jgi:hypothetical protein